MQPNLHDVMLVLRYVDDAYIALLPDLMELTAIEPFAFLVLSAVLIGVYGLVLAAYILATERARHMFRSRRALGVVNGALPR